MDPAAPGDAAEAEDAHLAAELAAELAAALHFNGLTLRQGFEAVDADADGQVSIEDLDAATSHFDLETASPAALAALFREMDVATTSRVGVEEWVRALDERRVRGAAVLRDRGLPASDLEEEETDAVQQQDKAGSVAVGPLPARKPAVSLVAMLRGMATAGPGAWWLRQRVRMEMEPDGLDEGANLRLGAQDLDGPQLDHSPSLVNQAWGTAVTSARRRCWRNRHHRASSTLAGRGGDSEQGSGRSGVRTTAGEGNRDGAHGSDRDREGEGAASQPRYLQTPGVDPRQRDSGESRRVVSATTRTVCDLYFKNALDEARRNPSSWCLGFVAVFLSVLLIAVLYSGYQYTPLVVLSVAQYQVGEVDAVVTPGAWTHHDSLNYTKFRAAAGVPDRQGWSFNFSAPRLSFPGTAAWSALRCQDTTEGQASTLTEAPVAGSRQDKDTLNPLNKSERYFGRDHTHPCARSPWSPDRSCVAAACGRRALSSLYVIDSELERRMGLGRQWPYGPVLPGHVYLQLPLARRLNVTTGDVILAQVAIGKVVSAVTPAALLEALPAHGVLSGFAMRSAVRTVLLPLRVQAVFESAHGKLPAEESDAMLVEYRHLFASLSAELVPGADQVAAAISRADSLSVVDSISVNLAPPRVASYMAHDFSVVQGRVLQFVQRLAARLGYDKVDVGLGLLRELRRLRLVSMFLGLVVSVAMTALSALLCLLIYSLLIVKVDARVYDMGVSRLLGMTRRQLVLQLLAHTLVLSAPATALGLLAAHLITAALMRQLAVVTKADLGPGVGGLQPGALGVALVMGLGVPMVAAVLPIRQALGVSLTDALDVRRRRLQLVAVSIYRAGQRRLPVALLCAALAMVVFGAVVYYVMPLALISFDLTLLLYLFFALLMGMIAGLTILALNLERPLEHAIAALMLCWLRGAMPALVHKNLAAHRHGNRKTTLIYALSIAFLVFVLVALTLQVVALEDQERQKMGSAVRLKCPIYMRSSSMTTLMRSVEMLLDDDAQVEDAAYVSHSLQSLSGHASYIKTLGRVFVHRNDVFAVSPNALRVLDPRFLAVSHSRQGLAPTSLSEELYTPAGSESMIVGALYRTSMALTLNQSLLLELRPFPWLHARLRPLAFLDGLAGFSQSPHPSVSRQDALVSFPTLARLLRQATGVESWQPTNIPIQFVHFRLRDATSSEQLDAIVNRLRLIQADTGCNVDDVRDKVRGLETAKQAIAVFATGTTAVALVICFFSLISSMLTNIHQQAQSPPPSTFSSCSVCYFCVRVELGACRRD